MVTIVGGLPHPRGGVTTFVSRLTAGIIAAEDSENVEILDLYPHQGKIVPEKGVDHRIAPSNGVARMLWLAKNTFNAPVVHFNFSTAKSILVMALLPKKRNRWILTLHHGNLSKDNLGLSLRAAWFLSRKKFDFVIALTEAQVQFFLSMGIESDKIHRLTSYIRKSCSEATPSTRIQKVVSGIKQSGKQLIFASGYPTKAYQHLELLKAFRRVQRDDIYLVLCIYGPDSENLRSSIEASAGEFDNVRILKEMPESDFDHLLQSSDVYVRANITDSCGIAVHDSVAHGTRVVASDACARPDQATVFPAGDIAMLANAIHAALLDTGQPQKNDRSNSLDEYLEIYNQASAA